MKLLIFCLLCVAYTLAWTHSHEQRLGRGRRAVSVLAAEGVGEMEAPYDPTKLSVRVVYCGG